MTKPKTKKHIPRVNEGKALSFILDNALQSGFGTLSKTELDLIIFSAILKFSDRDDVSDFSLSKYLQITPQRIRNLKARASVKYCSIKQEKAIEEFISKAKHSKADGAYIDIPIYDVAVANEIEAILEGNNLLLHSQLNPKVFRLRIDDFFDLIVQLEILASDGRKNAAGVEKKVIAALKKNKAKSKRLLDNLDEETKKSVGSENWTVETLKEALIKGGMSFGVDLLASLVPGGALFSGVAKSLLKAVSDKL